MVTWEGAEECVTDEFQGDCGQELWGTCGKLGFLPSVIGSHQRCQGRGRVACLLATKSDSFGKDWEGTDEGGI